MEAKLPSGSRKEGKSGVRRSGHFVPCPPHRPVFVALKGFSHRPLLLIWPLLALGIRPQAVYASRERANPKSNALLPLCGCQERPAGGARQITDVLRLKMKTSSTESFLPVRWAKTIAVAKTVSQRPTQSGKCMRARPPAIPTSIPLTGPVFTFFFQMKKMYLTMKKSFFGKGHSETEIAAKMACRSKCLSI